MKPDDSLWKGILEDLFADFLRFYFSNADEIFDRPGLPDAQVADVAAVSVAFVKKLRASLKKKKLENYPLSTVGPQKHNLIFKALTLEN
jgi:hypothetical protein